MSDVKVSLKDGMLQGHNKNQHVVEAVMAYCDFPYAQRYALMINGKWGSGKTHLVETLRELLDAKLVPDENARPLYVSLYGVTSAAEIGEQIYQQLHPILSGKGMRLAGILAKGFLKTTVKIDLNDIHKSDVSLGSQIPDIKLSDFLKGAKGRVVIFDDFERAKLDPIEILGFINPLVEHDGCKVIIVANEDMILEKEDYRLRKEKTVGQTLFVEPDVETAFAAFLEEIDDTSLRNFYHSKCDDILEVFKDSGLGNLRLLKQFLWEFEQFCAVLDGRHREHQTALLDMCLFLLATSLEIRSGNLLVKAFDPDVGQYMKQLEERGPEAKPRSKEFDDLQKQYLTVDFSGELVTRATAISIITRSVYDRVSILEQLNAHPLFSPPEDMPSWRALWFAPQQPVSEVPALISRFDEDFKRKRDYEEAELPHIIGIGLWLADIRQPGWSDGDIVQILKNFIRECYESRVARPKDQASAFGVDRIMNAAYGLEYKRYDDPDFELLSAYLETEAANWRARCLPAAAKALLDTLARGNESLFASDIYFSEQKRGCFVGVPILSYIDAQAFVDALGDLKPDQRRRVFIGLSSRYEHIAATPTLLPEENWIVEVIRLTLALAKRFEPIPCDALTKAVGFYLMPIISRFHQLHQQLEREQASVEDPNFTQIPAT